jgi:hypothetical protein
MLSKKGQIIERIVKAYGYEIRGNIDGLFHTKISFDELAEDLKEAKEMCPELFIFGIVKSGRKNIYVLQDTDDIKESVLAK